MSEERLYFAYGSNLDLRDLEKWCDRKGYDFPFEDGGRVACLPDFEPVFHYRSPRRGSGALDIRPRKGQAVPGALFTVKPQGWKAVDKKEGHPDYYKQVPVRALTTDGRELGATTYQVVPGRRAGFFIEPSREYEDIVRRGLSDFGLPAGMFEAVAKGREAPWLVDRVFTYGTLMRGECRESRLRFDGNVVSVTRACVPGALFDLGPYPGMRLSGEPDDMVHGDLYQVRHVGKTIEILDEIEGFKGYGKEGSLYRRALIQAWDESGSSFLAWIYIFEGPDAGVPIPSGDWRNR